jgi:drug/metabolite transporter (DMT)-like permease
MAILLALLSAGTFGTSDFLAGLASRRLPVATVTGIAAALGLLTAIVAVLLYSGDGIRSGAVLWGAASGVGNVLGTVALYHGLAVGRMSIVATLSGLLAATVPAIVGLIQGDGLSTVVAIGILIAIPAIAMVSWQPGESGTSAASGAQWGVLAGVGFALLFIALDRAGTGSGAWPLLSSEVIAVVLISPWAAVSLASAGRPAGRPVALAVVAGVLAGLANLAFLAATGHGELAVVAVLASLYPGVTVVLARLVLSERWSRLQVVGLFAALVAVVLVSAGSA